MTWLALALAALIVAIFAWIFWDIHYRLTDIPEQAAYDIRVMRRAGEAAANDAWASGRDEAFAAAIRCTLRRTGFVTAGQVADAIPLGVVA